MSVAEAFSLGTHNHAHNKRPPGGVASAFTSNRATYAGVAPSTHPASACSSNSAVIRSSFSAPQNRVPP